MTRVVLLGTGAGPTPKPGRQATAAVLCCGDASYLVDCGSGVGTQLVRAGIPLGSLRTIFITHHHIDHVADFGLVAAQAWTQLAQPVALIGPPPIRRMLSLFLELYAEDFESRVVEEGRRPLAELIDCRPFDAPGVVYADERVRVDACAVPHVPARHAYAYRFQTSDRCVVFSGDTAMSTDLGDFARGADTLIHEATYLTALDGRMPAADAAKLRARLQSAHCAVEDAARVAERARVRRLVLSPLTPSEGVDDATWIAAAAAHFDGEVIVGRDLLEV